MAIVQAGRPVTADDVKRTAGDIATALRDSAQSGADFAVQLQSWTDQDLLDLGLEQAQIDAIKGFYIGDLPAITNALKASAWIKQLLGTGV